MICTLKGMLKQLWDVEGLVGKGRVVQTKLIEIFRSGAKRQISVEPIRSLLYLLQGCCERYLIHPVDRLDVYFFESAA